MTQWKAQHMDEAIEAQEIYSRWTDPNDRPRPAPKPPRLWPWVVAGLVMALAVRMALANG